MCEVFFSGFSCFWGNVNFYNNKKWVYFIYFMSREERGEEYVGIVSLKMEVFLYIAEGV